MASPIDPAMRKTALKVIFVSLILDLISFTFILPLFPKLLEFYRSLEASSPASGSLLSRVLRAMNDYKNAFARPIDSRYDIVLLGGALGSLFSALQAIASPVIGMLSDRYGRRKTLLVSMCGNIASVLLWLLARDFRTFLASRVVGGLSEGNVQIATAIATDISDERQRGATMALIGACFCIAFTFGPALGAYLSSIPTVAANPFATAAGFSLALIVIETVYLYLYLPETLPSVRATTDSSAASNDSSKANGPTKRPIQRRTNSHFLLNFTHLTFILFFSGMEFSLPFMTYDLFALSSAANGRLLGFMGLISSLLQAAVTRRLPPLQAVKLGVTSCAVSLLLLSRLTSLVQLYAVAALIAVATATVVTGLNALSSFEAGEHERGEKLGHLRSWGQIGRAIGPVAFCSLYWWAGRETAYRVCGVGMCFVASLVWLGLRTPAGQGR